MAGKVEEIGNQWLQLEGGIHRELGTTFVYVTHDQEEALVLSDRIAVSTADGSNRSARAAGLLRRARHAVRRPATSSATPPMLRGEARSDLTGTALRIGDETVAVPGRVAVGASPVILLRPEKLVVRRPGQDGGHEPNKLSGTITEAIYLGSGSKYEVGLADGSTAIVRSPLSEDSYAIGDAVELRFRGEDAKLLADESSADTMPT